MEKAFNAGADKSNWTKVKFVGETIGNQYHLEPIFEDWYKIYLKLQS